MNPLRRGTCPGLADPMLTGDGLLARLTPSAPIDLDVFVALCEASQLHGNGVMEVTQRGSLQIRGLSPDSAAPFARTVTALGLGYEGGPQILASPLLGSDAEERVDLRALITGLRTELAQSIDAAAMGPKVSVLIDGGGVLHLDDVPADLRLRECGVSRLHVSIGGNASSSASLGWVETHHAVKLIVNLLAAISHRGAGARGRDFANDADVCALRASLADVLTFEPPPPPRSRAEPIGSHRLNNGQVARGVALLFGYVEAGILKRFVKAAARWGTTSIRAAPGRALLFIGSTAVMADDFAAMAAAAGLLVQPEDVRRRVVACAGAPACASATLSTRQLAPSIAQAAGLFLDGSTTIHVSGCAKGCAHPGAAALTLVGPDRVVVQGRASDVPHGTISPRNLIEGLKRLQAELSRSHTSHERSAQVISRLGAVRVVEALGGEPA
jgi:precorrin-3B synthase